MTMVNWDTTFYIWKVLETWKDTCRQNCYLKCTGTWMPHMGFSGTQNVILVQWWPWAVGHLLRWSTLGEGPEWTADATKGWRLSWLNDFLKLSRRSDMRWTAVYRGWISSSAYVSIYVRRTDGRSTIGPRIGGKHGFVPLHGFLLPVCSERRLTSLSDLNIDWLVL